MSINLAKVSKPLDNVNQSGRELDKHYRDAEEVRHPRVKGNVLHTHSLGVKVQYNVECVWMTRGCRTSSDRDVKVRGTQN